MSFSNRRDAGRRLAAALAEYAGLDPVVLALPRGGVPVAAEVADRLGGQLELLLVRKVGVPGQPELAAGAVVDGEPPIIVRNPQVIAQAHMSEEDFDAILRGELGELARRRQVYMGSRPFPEIRDRVVIVVDDGVATGASMRAALAGLRERGPSELIVAIPVGPRSTVKALGALADAVICLETPSLFMAIGNHYDDFRQVQDAEVVGLLERSRNRRGDHTRKV